LLRLIADPTRLRILSMLSENEMNVGAICGVLGQNQPAISHHLALLRVGGLVEARREGKNNFYIPTELGEYLSSMIRDIPERYARE